MGQETQEKSLAVLLQGLNTHSVPSLTKGAGVVHLRSQCFIYNNVLMRREKKKKKVFFNCNDSCVQQST